MEISRIVTEGRYRQELGDIAALAQSIRDVGLLHPIVVTPDGRLIAGARRLAACKSLGWADIPVTVVDLDEIMRGEHAENVYRKDFTPTEAVAIGRALEVRERGKAKERQATGWGDHSGSGKLPEPEWKRGDTRDKVGAAVGMSGRTYEKAKEVVDAAESKPETFGDLPELMDTKGVDRAFKEVRQRQRRLERIEIAAAVESKRAESILLERETWWSKNITLLHGDFRTLSDEIADESVDLVFTDPPYNEDAIPLYGDLARIAARILKPNGSLICYVGHYALPDVLPLMTPHLRFWWTLALEHCHQHARLPGKWIFVHWKPLLWFVKGGRRDNRYMGDLIRGVPSDKMLHEWQQGDVEAKYCIEHLTAPGDTVCDLMAGSGTTLVAALEMGRRVIGGEIESSHMDTIKERFHAYYTNISH